MKPPRPDRAHIAYWIDPEVQAPPMGRKLLLLTQGMVATLGHWGDDCIAWSPLPKVPRSIADRNLRRFLRLPLDKKEREVTNG